MGEEKEGSAVNRDTVQDHKTSLHTLLAAFKSCLRLEAMESGLGGTFLGLLKQVGLPFPWVAFYPQ